MIEYARRGFQKLNTTRLSQNGYERKRRELNNYIYFIYIMSMAIYAYMLG